MGLLDWWNNLWRPRGKRSAVTDLYETADYPPVSASAFMSGRLKLRAGVHTTVGNVREHNEDNFYVPGLVGLHAVRPSPTTMSEIPPGGLTTVSGVMDTPPPTPPVPPAADLPNGPPPSPHNLFVVADGMGGQMAGERASLMAVEIIPVELDRRLGPAHEFLDEKAVRNAIRDAVAKANEEILAQSHLDTDCNNMGTTVVLSLFRHDRVYIAGVGDSRAYRLREGRIEMLTEDHSLARALEKAGTIRADEVESHKFKHVLYLYLGSRDVGSGPEEVKTLEIRPGDRFLLATDGLTGVVNDDEIADALGRIEDPQKAAEHLVQRAIDNQSKDNITCLVVHVD